MLFITLLRARYAECFVYGARTIIVMRLRRSLLFRYRYHLLLFDIAECRATPPARC